MNKLFATIVLAAFALSGCIKEDDSYKELLPLRPGMNIYSMTVTQNAVAMQPANAGIRLAMLLAEAEKQKDSGTELKDVDLTKLEIEVGNKRYAVLNLLFTAGTKIERQENGDYKITYNGDYQQYDGFFLKGSMLVKTGGVEQLKDTHGSQVWQVVIEEGLTLSARSDIGTSTVVNMEEGGSTTLYNEGLSYTVSLSGISASFENSSVSSSWRGDFSLSSPNADLVYSECRGKDFKVRGDAGGYSMYTGIDSSNLSMSYYLNSGSVYRSGQIIEGTQECSFESFNYDTAAYPSPDVKYVWSNDGNKLYQKIYYNGYVYPKN